MDGDGDIDVLSASQFDDKIAWYENLGNGNFSSQRVITTQADWALCVFSADMDGDGDEDVLSASNEDNKIAWYENLGGGEFSSQQIIKTQENSGCVYATDLDGDGDADVIGSGWGLYCYENCGTYFTQRKYSADVFLDVYATDLDGDGDADILAAAYNDNYVVWFENLGNWKFTRHSLYGTIQRPTGIYAADMDGDGDADILTASAADDKIAWYENLGDGDFAWQQVISKEAQGAQSVYAANIDGDGDVDVLSASENDHKVAWYENLKHGNFSPQQVISTFTIWPRRVFAADLDGDEDVDILSASDLDNKLAWYENLGGGNFARQKIISTDLNSVRSIYATDLDGDEDVDILAVSFGLQQIVWFENLGEGNFSNSQFISYGCHESVYATDLDGDGDADILAGYNYAYWCENLGEGRFSERQAISSDIIVPQSIYATDIDDDGDADILAATSDESRIVWYEYLGDGNFSTAREVSITPNRVGCIYATDLDADGDVDILSVSSKDNMIAWYENLGGGSFSSQKIITTAANGAYCVYAIDLDNDGNTDVLSASVNDDKIAWYKNFGGGRFSSQRVITIEADRAMSVYAADLDSDGDADVLSASFDDNKIAWYENLLIVNPPQITLALPRQATEGDGILAGQGTIIVDQAPDMDVVVHLSSDDTSELAVSTTVMIPAGQTSATFILAIQNDSLIDGTQTATVTAHVDGWTDGQASMQILDNEIPEIIITLPTQATEGDGVLIGQGQITISLARAEDLVVSLTSSDTSELTVPETVTILAGQTSAIFTITIVDDSELDFTKSVTVTASADGHVSDAASISIHDNDVGTLTVSLPANATEGDGVLAGQGTVTIDQALAVDVVVSLFSGDVSELVVPSTVTIPAGQTSATFNLVVLQDALWDGTQTATVTAHVAGWVDGQATMEILDGPVELTVIVPQKATEGDGVLQFAGTVTLSSTPLADILVSLVSSDTTEVVVPVSVIIPAGQRSATFSVTIVDDTVLDGMQSATITASAAGVESAEDTVVVEDNDTATLSILTPATANENAGVLIGQGVVNIDQVLLYDLTVNLTSSDVTEVVVPASVIIPAGQTSATFNLDIQQDNIWDGTQQATITAHVDNWADGTAQVDVVDINPPAVTLTLPAEVTENGGLLQNQGQVVIDQPLGNDLLLNLSSNNTSILQVPQSVTIPAGQTSATFNITLQNDWLVNGDTTISVSAADSTGLVTGQADVLVLDVPPSMDQYLIHPSVYNVGNYWNYDLFITQMSGRDVTQYNIHGSLSEKVTRNVVYNGQKAFEFVQNSNIFGDKSSSIETRCLTDGFVRLLKYKSSSGTDVYTNPTELYWLGIPGNDSGIIGDGGAYGDSTETRTYTIQGTGKVTVSAGTFDCYIITINETDVTPGETTFYSTETLYFNPYIGIVKDEVTLRKGSDSYSFTQTLKKTNVRLPGDLTAEVLAPVNASNLVSGDVVRVPVRVTNVGTQASSGKMNIEVYVKDSQQVLHTDTPAVVLKSVKVNLKPGASATYYANVQLPLGVEGELYCIAKIDPANTIVETDESNNTATLGNSLNVALGYTDLVGQLGKVSLPSAVVAGQRVKGSVQVQVRNAGNVKLGSQARANIAVYATNTATGEQILLGHLTNRSLANLAANGAKAATFTVAVNLPAGVAKGEYEIEALITPVSGVGETNLTNNRATGLLGGPAVGLTAADPFIDLVAGVNEKLAASAKYALPANVVSGVGKVLYVPITITNAGNISTARSQRIDVNLYAQNEAGEQFLLGIFTKQNVGSLAPGKTKSFTYKTTLPASLATGEYTIVADIDASDVVAESDETNNAATLTRNMNVQEGFVDLTPEVVKVQCITNRNWSQQVVVWVKIQNQGNVTCKGKVNIQAEAISMYMSTEYTLEGIISAEKVVALRPGQSSIVKLVSPVLNLAEGDYDLRVTLEAGEGITEGGIFGVTNNTVLARDAFHVSASPFTSGIITHPVSGDQPDLTVSIGDPADGKPAATGWARIDVKNEGTAAANDKVDIELWCTSDGVIDGSAGDYLLKTITNQSLLLLPGETQYVWANYQLPEGVNPAGVELIAVVDTGNAIPEVNEDNNFGLIISNWGANT